MVGYGWVRGGGCKIVFNFYFSLYQTVKLPALYSLADILSSASDNFECKNELIMERIFLNCSNYLIIFIWVGEG